VGPASAALIAKADSLQFCNQLDCRKIETCARHQHQSGAFAKHQQLELKLCWGAPYCVLPSLNLFPGLKRLSCHPHIWKYLLFSIVFLSKPSLGPVLQLMMSHI
jgi:hypothetical protein